ncbi:MAG: YbhB/YbcL family Raf kinase inhibitor-like protein [Candidatus Protochlamydia sp.]|nr:YbhB/YbcL family Raf kinase inhibitor-like protein [Candidatus Protochlamydia sp.]
METKKFTLTSSAFKNLDRIPPDYACDQLGNNLSPPLSWSHPPSGTKSFAITCVDPDSPTGRFTHWIIYDIPAAANRLEEGIEPSEKLANGTLQGINSFEKIGFDGPCPPAGLPHHYIFTLYALDRMLRIEGEITLIVFEKAIRHHVLGKAELAGLFQR